MNLAKLKYELAAAFAYWTKYYSIACPNSVNRTQTSVEFLLIIRQVAIIRSAYSWAFTNTHLFLQVPDVSEIKTYYFNHGVENKDSNDQYFVRISHIRVLYVEHQGFWRKPEWEEEDVEEQRDLKRFTGHHFIS